MKLLSSQVLDEKLILIPYSSPLFFLGVVFEVMTFKSNKHELPTSRLLNFMKDTNQIL
jgi:hypothetical protein